MFMSVIPWLVLLVPLAGVVLIALVSRRAAGLSAFISVVAVSIGFICRCVVCAKPEVRAAEIRGIVLAGLLRLPVGVGLDYVSNTMLVVVSGAVALIHGS